MLRVALGLMFLVAPLAGCSDGSSADLNTVETGESSTPVPLEDGLLSISQLPGGWKVFPLPDDPGGESEGPCGEDPTGPEPEETAAAAWIQDPDDGPIFGIRLERLDGSGAEDVMEAGEERELPCEWDEDGGSWRMTRLSAPDLGDESILNLVVSLDRPDSFNYHAAIRSDDVLLLAVLNIRHPDEDLLNELLTVLWQHNLAAGLVS